METILKRMCHLLSFTK